MHIGDKIRFLNQTGGGIVVGFEKKGRILVEDEDGFQIPMPEKECVVVEENSIGKKDGKPAGENEPVIQTRNGEKLNIALLFTRDQEEYTCILANECNYHLLAELAFKYPSGTVTPFAGEVLPYERKTLFKFRKEALSHLSKKGCIRAIPFKREPLVQGIFNGPKGAENTQKTIPVKPVIEKEFILDPLNLIKESVFKTNDYISGDGYVLPIINENNSQPEIEDLAAYWDAADKNLKKELKAKFTAPPHTGKTPAEPGTRSPAGIIEVDLHAAELLETTSGMGNGDILRYQIEQFNQTMTAWLHKKGTKIVFIHGKGDGILRNAIIKELKNKYSRSKWQDASFKEYGYGATLVTIG